MTDNNEETEFVALCHDSWGKAYTKEEALLSMVDRYTQDFSDRGQCMRVTIVEGVGLSIQHAHGQALVDHKKKVNEQQYELDTDMLDKLRSIAIKGQSIASSTLREGEYNEGEEGIVDAGE